MKGLSLQLRKDSPYIAEDGSCPSVSDWNNINNNIHVENYSSYANDVVQIRAGELNQPV